MRQRITFVHKAEDAVDPETLKVSKDSLRGPSLKAAREDRITWDFDELPHEIQMVLNQSHELHLRYVKSTHAEEVAPFYAKLSPGLHVYFSPQRMDSNADLLCPLLNKIFEPDVSVRCQSPEKSFTLLPAQRFQHSTAYEYYLPQYQFHRYSFVDYLRAFCPATDVSCRQRVELLQTANSIDIDFDAISHVLTMSATGHSQAWDLDIVNTGVQDRLEVGILSNEQAIEPEELSFGGFLTVVGEDTKPSPTLFSFPSRHHRQTSAFSARFLQPSGLHPNLQLHVSDSHPPAEHETCSLHAYFTFPRVIFADKYQLHDPLFMASKNLSALRYITSPVDLEAPEYTTSLWGSSLLLELAPPAPSAESWTAEVPLHLRYLAPNPTGFAPAEVPWPILFWACNADEGTKFTINPFDRVNLGYDGLFGPRTMFYHLTTQQDPSSLDSDAALYSRIQVPVLNTQYSAWVETGTAAVILLGFGWVLLALFRVWRREGYGSHESIEGRKKVQ